jgi:hypothetical protein
MPSLGVLNFLLGIRRTSSGGAYAPVALALAGRGWAGDGLAQAELGE